MRWEVFCDWLVPTPVAVPVGVLLWSPDICACLAASALTFSRAFWRLLLSCSFNLARISYSDRRVEARFMSASRLCSMLNIFISNRYYKPSITILGGQLKQTSSFGVPGTVEGDPELCLESGGVKRNRPNLSVARLPPCGVGAGLSGTLLGGGALGLCWCWC